MAPTPTTCARCWRNTRSISDGKVKLEFFDPEPFSDTEDRAMAYGLQGVPVDQAGTQVYFGLAGTNLEDDERTIPFFQAGARALPGIRPDQAGL